MLSTLIIQSFLFILSYLIPKKKNLIVLGAGEKEEFKGNPKYFYLYLNYYKPEIKAVWSTNSKTLIKELTSKKLPVLQRKSFKGFFMILRAKYLVIEKSAKDVYYTSSIWGRFNFIQTWHGIVFKKTGLEALEEKKGLPGQDILASERIRRLMRSFGLLSMMKYKLILSTSKQYEDLLKKSFLNKNVKTLGYPRNDIFFNNNLVYIDFNKLLKLSKYKRVILYAPTFRDNKEQVIPFTGDFLSKMNDFLEDDNQLLLVKKHPLDNSIKIPNNFNAIRDVSSIVNDVQDLLVYTDVLISDYSSIIHDFILTRRPIIYYIYDFEEYEKNCRGFYYDYHKTLSGPFITNEEHLLETIKKIGIWHLDKNYIIKYNQQLNLFHTFTDGNSSNRLYNSLLKN